MHEGWNDLQFISVVQSFTGSHSGAVIPLQKWLRNQEEITTLWLREKKPTPLTFMFLLHHSQSQPALPQVVMQDELNLQSPNHSCRAHSSPAQTTSTPDSLGAWSLSSPNPPFLAMGVPRHQLAILCHSSPNAIMPLPEPLICTSLLLHGTSLCPCQHLIHPSSVTILCLDLCIHILFQIWKYWPEQIVRFMCVCVIHAGSCAEFLPLHETYVCPCSCAQLSPNHEISYMCSCRQTHACLTTCCWESGGSWKIRIRSCYLTGP